MKTAHTPGPWKIEETSANSAFVDVVGEDGWLVAEIEPNNPNAEANARLIAAAPELLAAMNRLVSDHEQGLSFDIVWADAKAAISKATEGRP